MVSLILLGLISADWQPLPPVGSSSIKSLYGIGDTLVACGATGCALAVEQGARWVAPVNHIPFEGVPNHSGATFVTPAQKVMRSTDMGRTWSAWSDGFPAGLTPEAVALQGKRAFLSAYKMRQKAGLSIVHDTCVWFVRNGESTSWTRLDSAETSECSGIAIGHDGTLFRSSKKMDAQFATTLLVESSADLGKSWTPVQTGAYLKRFHDGTLGMNNYNGDSSLLSLDSGRTWKRSGYVNAGSYLDGAILAEGSEDWKDLRTGTTRAFDLDSLGKIVSWARTGRILWAQGNWGLFSSSDSGKSWKRADRNCPMSSTPSLRWHDGALYANTIQGARYILARSTDDGKSWKQLTQASRGLGRLESCGDKLMAEEYDGTLVVTGETASILDMGQSVGAISCLGTKAYGLADGELVSWSGATNWSSFGNVAFKEPLELAATPAGLFARIGDWDDDNMRVDFIANGSSIVEAAKIPSYVKSVTGSARGAWVSSPRGLYRCTDAQHCTAENPQGADSLWSFSTATIQGPFVLVSAIRYGLDLMYDYSETRLFASSDSGKSWTALPTPFAVQSAAVTPAGIVASVYGVGLQLLPSDTFRVTGVSPRLPARGAAPSLVARGRILSLSGLVPGARLRVLDASGRVVLDVRPEVRDGKAAAMLPAGASGILFARLESDGKSSSFRWVESGR